jgi:hypothetical protein
MNLELHISELTGRRYEKVIVFGFIAIYLLLWWIGWDASRTAHYGRTYTYIYGYTYMWSGLVGFTLAVLLKIIYRAKPSGAATGTIVNQFRVYRTPLILLALSVAVFAIDAAFIRRPIFGLIAYGLAGSGVSGLVVRIIRNAE